MNEFLWELAWLGHINANRKVWKLYVDAMPSMRLIRRVLSAESWTQ